MPLNFKSVKFSNYLTISTINLQENSTTSLKKFSNLPQEPPGWSSRSKNCEKYQIGENLVSDDFYLRFSERIENDTQTVFQSLCESPRGDGPKNAVKYPVWENFLISLRYSSEIFEKYFSTTYPGFSKQFELWISKNSRISEPWNGGKPAFPFSSGIMDLANPCIVVGSCLVALRGHLLLKGT